MRYRKNIDCLSADELHDLREAFAGIYALPDEDPNGFAVIGGLHGNPAPGYCIHSNAGFLSWHRAYLLELENALRRIHCDVVLPYWNWSSGSGITIPDACKDPTYVNRDGATVDNPLYSGPLPSSLGGGATSRGGGIGSTTFDDLAETATDALGETDWSSFVSQLNGVHGSVHVRIGGNMASVATAGFDPIFYLHHANVDRLWARWQQSNPGALASSEAGAVLQPFTRHYSSDWHLGSDFENTTDWDYKYQLLCISFIPIPWPLERVFRFPIGDWFFSAERIALSLSMDMMPRQSFELLVFVNNEDATVGTRRDREHGFAGSIGLFGMGNARMLERKGETFRYDLDITSTLRKFVEEQGRKGSITLVPDLPEGQNPGEEDLKNLSVGLEIR